MYHTECHDEGEEEADETLFTGEGTLHSRGEVRYIDMHGRHQKKSQGDPWIRLLIERRPASVYARLRLVVCRNIGNPAE